MEDSDLLEIIRKCHLQSNARVLRLNQVKLKLGIAHSTIWAAVKGGLLPPPFSISGRSVGWLESEIDAIIEARIFCARQGRPLEMVNFVRNLTCRTSTNTVAVKTINP